MPKHTHLTIILIFALIFMPDTGFSARPIQTSQRIIVLDPGHGGLRNGLISSSGLKEKNITLQLARKTAQKLEIRYNVLLTRTDDINIPAEDRMSIANHGKAALFISIHLHSSQTPAAFFYYYDTPHSKTALKNKTDNTWTFSPLEHKIQNIRAAKKFAQIFSTRDPAINIHIKKIPAIILEGATMPAILIEPFSISDLPVHPVKSDAVLDTYAQLIKNCVDQYFE